MSSWRPSLSVLLVVAGALALALAATWPLPRYLGQAVAGEKIGFAFTLNTWAAELPPWQLFDAQVDWLNYPDGGEIVLVAMPQIVLAGLFSLVLGPTAAQNLSYLAHLAFGVVASAALVLQLRPERGPAALAAAFAVGAGTGLSCGMLSVLGNGQPENLGLGYLALAATGAVALVRDGRSWGAAVLAAGTGLAFVSSPYLLMGPLLGAPILLLAFRGAPAKRLAGASLIVGLVCLPLVGHYQATTAGAGDSLLCPATLDAQPGADRRLPLAQLGQALAQPPAKGTEILVADPARLLTPGRRPVGQDHLPADYLGWIPLIAAVASCRRSRGSRWLLLAALPALVLALGPALVVNGWWLTIASGATLRLPLAWLAGLPVVGGLLSSVQVPVRLLFGATLYVALAGAPAWSALGKRVLALPGGSGLLVLLALSPALEQLTIGPAAPPQPLLSTRPGDAHLLLAQQPDHRALLETPPIGWDRQRPSFVASKGAPPPPPVAVQRRLVAGHVTHGRPVPMSGCFERNLLHPAVGESSFQQAVVEILIGTPQRADLGLAAAPLVAQGFGWYVLHTGTGLVLPDAEARLLTAALEDLELVGQGDDGSYLFRLPGWSP